MNIEENASATPAEQVAAEGASAAQAEQGTVEGGLLSAQQEVQPENIRQEGENDNAGDKDKQVEDKQAEDNNPPGAPENYEDFKFDEKLNVNDEAKENFKVLAKKLNLTQESAQALVDFQGELLTKQLAADNAKFEETVKGWREESVKTYSNEQLADAVRGFNDAPKEMQEYLKQSGLENHPKFIEFFCRYGQMIKETKFVTGKPAGASLSAAEVLYPGLSK